MRYLKAALIFTLLFASPALAQAENIYTIAIASTTQLEKAKAIAKKISRIADLSVRVEKRGIHYVVLAGKSKDKNKLFPPLEKLMAKGYLHAKVKEQPYQKGNVVFNIYAAAAEKKPEMLRAYKKKRSKTGVVEMPEEEKIKAEAAKGKRYIGIAWGYYQKRDFNKAMEFFNFARSFPEVLLDAKLGIAYCYVKLKKPEEAFPILEQLAKQQYKLKDVYSTVLDVGWQYFNQKNYDKAIEFFLYPLPFKETELGAKLGLSFCYVKQEKPEKAIVLLAELAKRRHKRKIVINAILDIGRQQVAKGKYDKAIEYFSYALPYKRYALDTKFAMADCYLQQKKNEKALAILDQLAKKKYKFEEVTTSIKSIAWEQFSKGKYDKAIAYYSYLLSYPATKQSAKLDIANCYIKQKNPGKAMVLLEELAQTKYKFKDVTAAMFGIGWQHFDQGKYEEAVKYFSYLLRYPETELEAKLATASSYTKQKKREEAIALLEELAQKSYKFSQVTAAMFGIGWDYFSAAKYNEAVKCFSYLLSYEETKPEAKLALANSYLKLKQPDKGVLLLKELANSGYEPQKVAAALVPILYANGEYDQAIKYVAKLEKVERSKWENIIRNREKGAHEKTVREAFAVAAKSRNANTLMKVTKTYNKELQACEMPDLFYETAKDLVELNKVREVRKIYRDLLSACSTNWAFRPAIFYGFKEILTVEEMLPLLQKELKRSKLPDKYRKQVATIEMDLYKEAFAELDPSSAEIKELAEKILKAQPEAHFVLASLGWWNFNNKDYQKAYEIFSKLNNKFPEEMENNLQGLMLSLAHLNRPEEAIKVLEKAKFENPEKKLEALRGMLAQVDPASLPAKQLAGKVLKIFPGDPVALTILAWWDYYNGRYQTAYEGFSKLREKASDSKGVMKGLIYCLLKLDKTDEALALYEKEGSRDPELMLYILSSKLALLDPSTEEVKELANKILEDFPEDEASQSTLAWWYYHRGEFKTAYEKFQKLYQKNPRHLTGLLDSMVKLGYHDRFEKVVEQVKNKDASMNTFIGKRYARIASSVAAKKEFNKAEMYLKKAISFAPKTASITKQLAWIYYKQEKLDDALTLASSLYQRGKSAELAGMILLFYDKLGKEKEARLFVNTLKGKRSRSYKKIVKGHNIKVYREKAKTAYETEQYKEAETFYTMALLENPEDTKMGERLAESKFKQTRLAKILSLVEGLPGHTWGGGAKDVNGMTGTELIFTVNQGIDWVTFPGDITLNTFAEYGYRNRTMENIYFRQRSKTLGVELQKGFLRLGVEYSWEKFPNLHQTDLIKNQYVDWYYDWYKFMRRKLSDSWVKFDSFTGHSYGRLNNDIDNDTGTGISGVVNQGIDWFTLPGDITFNTYAEYRFSFRTKDNYYYNYHSTGVGMVFEKAAFEVGIEYFRQRFTKQNITEKNLEVYVKWYHDWDVKSYLLKLKKMAIPTVRKFKERIGEH